MINIQFKYLKLKTRKSYIRIFYESQLYQLVEEHQLLIIIAPKLLYIHFMVLLTIQITRRF